MSRSDEAVRLRHMLDHAREAVAMASGRTRADLAANRMLELALVRLVEIIGKAAARVSDETRSRYPEIEWRIIAGMRHRLVHGYDTVDHDVLWDTVQQDLPGLIVKLAAALPPDRL